MIIKELSKYIVFDEIRTNANPLEVYFLSHLLDNEPFTIPANWSGKIYTSNFIFDILSKNKPEENQKYFNLLVPNFPIKLKSAEKTIVVTMFETEEITKNVMFFFDDGAATFLYTGVFTEIAGLYANELFMSYVEKGMDNVYVDTTRCKGTSYIFTEETVEEIKQISNSHPDSKLAVIIPALGYEKLLVYLAKEFPQEVYPTKHQRRILSKLGYKDLLSKSLYSRIIILLPGITPEVIESTKNVVTVYIIPGKAPTTTSVCGMYLKQWSPLPSLKDLQALLDIIRPKNIFPIRKGFLDENTTLPASLNWFTAKRRTGGDDVRSNADTNESHESETDNDSICSLASSTSTRCGGGTDFVSVSQAPIREFVHPGCRSKESNLNSAKEHNESLEKVVRPPITHERTESPDKSPTVPKRVNKNNDLTQKRRRIIRQRHDIEFADSDEDE